MCRAGFAGAEKIIAGGSAPAPWVTFSCLSKRKSPKRKTPGRFAAPISRGSLRASLRPGASPTRRAHAPGARRSAARSFGGMEVHRTSMNTPPYPRARSGVSRRLPAWLGARLAPTGFLKNPYGTRAHRQPLPASPKGRGQEARGLRAATRTSRRATARQRRDAQRVVVPSGACFLLVSFLCTSKEKKPWVRGGSIPLLFFQSCALRTHKQSSVGQLPTSKCRRKRLD
jgi:hypothetical protein